MIEARSTLSRLCIVARGRPMVRRRVRLTTGALSAVMLATIPSALPAEPPRSAAADPAAEFRQAVEDSLRAGRPEAASRVASDWMEWAEETHGDPSPELGDALERWVVSLLRGGSTGEEVEEGTKRLLSVRERVQLDSYPHAVAIRLSGELARTRGSYDQARPLLTDAFHMAERALPPDDLQLAPFLRELGNLYAAQTDYAEARGYFERELVLATRELGKDHPELATRYYELGRIDRAMGDYRSAMQRYERAYDLLHNNDPDDHRIAWVLNGMANTYDEVGDYVRARDLYEQAIAIAEASIGPEHPFVAACLNNLGIVLQNLGDYEASKEVLLRSLALLRKTWGDEHEAVAKRLENLAEVHLELGEIDEARRFHEEALAMRQHLLGPDHPAVATSLDALGLVLLEVGELELARSHMEDGLRIREQVVGVDHPDVAMSLLHLGSLLRTTGELEAARAQHLRAQSILERALGPGHPRGAEVSLELALDEAGLGAWSRGLDAALRAERISREHLVLTSLGLPEREALAYDRSRQSGLGLALSILADGRVSAGVDAVWDAVIRSRALVLDEMAARQRVVAETGDPELETVRATVAEASRDLANLVIAGLGEATIEEYQAELQAARQRKERAERRLAERSASYRGELERRGVGLSEVLDCLPMGAALVAYVAFERTETAEVNALKAYAPETEPWLGAFVRTSTGSSTFHALGSAAAIDALVDRWRGQAIAPESEDTLYGAGEDLLRSIWDPLRPSLAEVESIYVVPAGSLHLVNFTALPDGPGTYLIETAPAIRLVSAERDLCSHRPAPETAERILVVGGVAFDAVTPAESEATLGEADRIETEARRSGCGDLSTTRFEPLPGSAEEASEVAGLWSAGSAERDVIHLEGRAPTEAAIKHWAPLCDVLHLATHGFFLDANCRGPAEAGRGIGGVSPERAPMPGFLLESPLLHAGLACAGANQRGEEETAIEDGILTAEEIATLDLTRARVAVLSACDTGIGRIESSEGVLGLRRAFHTAGTGSLVMSLWPVDDLSTARWMQHLHQGLETGTSPGDAARQASLAILQELRTARKPTHPLRWASFVAVGIE